MRKYRGLTKDGKWVYGWYCAIESTHFIIPKTASIHAPDWRFCPSIWGHKEVDPETVGQSTGLKDKNSKEDWINDIVKAKVGPIQLISIEHENIGNIHENPELLKCESKTT
jgi:hypothetical protein